MLRGELLGYEAFGLRVHYGVSLHLKESDTEMGLDVVDTLCFPLGGAGFGAYWDGSDRLIPDKGDLRDYWIEISSDRDFLGPRPSYVLILRPWTANVPHLLAQYLFRHAEGGEKWGQRCRRDFLGVWLMHYGLVNDQRGCRLLTAGRPMRPMRLVAVDEGCSGDLAQRRHLRTSLPAFLAKTMSQRIERI
ncbi:hypothetical protein Tco_0663506 [Tanacetum coccineum]